MSLKIALEKIEKAKKTNAEELDLSNLDLKEIPTEITGLTSLTSLQLDRNQISEIKGLETLTSLTSLHLDRNQISEIKGLETLTSLTSLHLSGNQISEIKGLETLTSLTSLYLDRNQISEIKGLETLTSLTLLYLYSNQISEIKGLETLTSLTLLHLHSNQIKEIKGLEQLTSLVDLALSFNRIMKIKGLEQLILLERIYLNHNQIKEIEGLEQLTLLKKISLHQNQIKEIKGLELAISLKELRLYDNQIKVIKGLDELTSLKSVGLSNNNITRIPNYLLDLKIPILLEKIALTSEKGVFLRNNPLMVPPHEIIEQGNNAISIFLEELQDSQPLNEVKVILIGEGASGKTSLVRQILNEEFNPKEEQTHGIKISKDVFDVQDDKLVVNFWDFGGQEIMHATHQFFLTKRCLYLLVLDSRKDEKAEYWLKHVQSFGGNAPVIVVLNKIDENPSFDVNRKFLTEKYPNIQAFYKVSCKSQKGIKELKNELLKSLWNLQLRNMPFPKTWFAVKNYFQSMEEDYISYARFIKICEENNVTNLNSQKFLLEFLNDLGIILNYEELEMDTTQVLNPLWLTNAVYRIINSPIPVEKNGRLNTSDLDEIVNDDRYKNENNIEKAVKIPKGKFPFILGIMEEFELIYRINRKQYIIPELLPIKQKAYDFLSEETILRFIFEYPDFLPTSIIPRLMVKMHKYVYKNQVWKTGMVLEERLIFKSIANVVLDRESRRINIEVAGERPRDFLTVIRETIKEIRDDFQLLTMHEWIPLTEGDAEEVLVEYQELLGYEKEKETHFFSGKLRKKFLVSDLLNGIENPRLRTALPCKVFISYSEKDERFKEELIQHLNPLVKSNSAQLWHTSKLLAGEDREKAIASNLENADLVLCLITSNYISSKACYDKELQYALTQQSEVKKVIPIKVKKVLWKVLPVSKLKSLPSQWIKELNHDDAWMEIAEGVEKAIIEIQDAKRDKLKDKEELMDF